jgi:hypothetical protein
LLTSKVEKKKMRKIREKEGQDGEMCMGLLSFF